MLGESKHWTDRRYGALYLVNLFTVHFYGVLIVNQQKDEPAHSLHVDPTLRDVFYHDPFVRHQVVEQNICTQVTALMSAFENIDSDHHCDFKHFVPVNICS